VKTAALIHQIIVLKKYACNLIPLAASNASSSGQGINCFFKMRHLIFSLTLRSSVTKLERLVQVFHEISPCRCIETTMTEPGCCFVR
jgi:hypothetical protein